ncbi:MAG: portal protein [Bacillota bacterium]
MLFAEGKQYPPQEELDRLAEYEIGKKFYDAEGHDVVEKASVLLKNTPHYKNIDTLRTAVGLVEILCKKPADMLIAERPIFESGQKGTVVQQRLDEMVENNDLIQMIYEMTVSNGYLGDQFIKTYYSYRQDYSELVQLGGQIPPRISREIILEAVNPRIVFVEFKEGTQKIVKAYNIAYVEWEEYGYTEVPFLYVERHIAGAIQYKKFRLSTPNVQMIKNVPLTTFLIEEEVSTGKENDLLFTGVEYPLVQHIPYKATVDSFYGESFVKRVKDYIIGIQDTLTSISYILAKHTDPIIVSPPIDGNSQEVKMTGGILEVDENAVKPYYMVWDGRLSDSFKLLEYYVNMVFQAAETPQWIFGNVVGSGNQAGGTSHTTEGSNLTRFMPLLAKVRAIRNHVDKAIRTILWISMELENYTKDGLEGFSSYKPVYPVIHWKDGVPKDRKALAEGLAIANGGKPVLDHKSSIKEFNDCDDETAQTIFDEVQEDEKRTALAAPSIFNDGEGEELAD